MEKTKSIHETTRSATNSKSSFQSISCDFVDEFILTVLNQRAFLIRSSTSGGTSPWIGPPSWKTSFTRRELTYEYASAGIMKTVSIAGSNRRFIKAICNSYS